MRLFSFKSSYDLFRVFSEGLLSTTGVRCCVVID